VLLCWLALLLIRVAETEIGDTWFNIRHVLGKIHLGKFQGIKGEVLQKTNRANQSTKRLF